MEEDLKVYLIIYSTRVHWWKPNKASYSKARRKQFALNLDTLHGRIFSYLAEIAYPPGNLQNLCSMKIHKKKRRINIFKIFLSHLTCYRPHRLFELGC